MNFRKGQKLDVELVVLMVASNQSAERKRDVTQFVYACVTCKSSKVRHLKMVGMLRPLNVSEWK